MKTEPTCFSIDDLKKKKVEPWSGVRNYQARNHIKAMKKGDQVIIWHSSCAVPAAVGIGKVVAEARPDLTALDKKDEHYDPKATKEKPIWECVDIGFVSQFKKEVSLARIRREKALSGMVIVQPGSRLSVTPVTPKEFDTILALAKEMK